MCLEFVWFVTGSIIIELHACLLMEECQGGYLPFNCCHASIAFACFYSGQKLLVDKIFRCIECIESKPVCDYITSSIGLVPQWANWSLLASSSLSNQLVTISLSALLSMSPLAFTDEPVTRTHSCIHANAGMNVIEWQP